MKRIVKPFKITGLLLTALFCLNVGYDQVSISTFLPTVGCFLV